MAIFKLVNGRLEEQAPEIKLTENMMLENIDEVKKIAQAEIEKNKVEAESKMTMMKEEIDNKNAEINRLTRQLEKLKKGQ